MIALPAAVALIGDRQRDRHVVAQADDGASLLRVIGGHKPDLAIGDVRLPPTAGACGRPRSTAVAERLAESAAERYPGITPVGFCFGVAACEAGAGTLDDLMRSADRALYTQKRARYGGASSKTPLNAPMGRR